MSLSALSRYSIPALIVGSLGGYFVGDTLAAKSGKSAKNSQSLRQQFLSSEEDDAVDYNKLARVCVSAAQRGAPRAPLQLGAQQPAQPADYDEDDVAEAKGRLDKVIAASLEEGRWTRGAGMVARRLLDRLPPSDIADFESLFRSTMASGHVSVQPGAWTPGRLN